jgi:hypothetical protein
MNPPGRHGRPEPTKIGVRRAIVGAEVTRAGQVLLPDEEGYDAERAGWSLVVEHHPKVIEEAGPYGLAPLVGSTSDVSAVGYLTGGGLPVLGRRYGFAADHVRALELVTADGRPRLVTANRHPELFWAVRGGKGNFGIVTAVETDLMPVNRLYGGGLFFPGAATREVLSGWLAWTASQPEEMCSSLALFPRPPPLGWSPRRPRSPSSSSSA